MRLDRDVRASPAEDLETGDRFACAVADPFSPSYNARVIASTLFYKALCANAELKNREYNLNTPRPGRSSVTGRGLETGDRFACAVADPFSPSYNAARYRVHAFLQSVV